MGQELERVAKNTEKVRRGRALIAMALLFVPGQAVAQEVGTPAPDVQVLLDRAR